MTRAELVEVLRDALKGYPGLEFALLFGSWARGEQRGQSDVDVAFMPVGDWTLAAELDLQARLARAARATIDLIRLDRAPLLVAWEVVRDGVTIIGDDARLARYRAYVSLEHADAAPALEQAARHYARRIAELGVPH